MLMVLSPKTLEPRDMAAYIKVQYSIHSRNAGL